MNTLRNCIMLLALFGCGIAQAAAPDAEELTALLNGFLAGASANDLAAHERFWADDLIYTSSTGERFNKAEILQRNSTSDGPEATDEPEVVYTAEDIRIQQYGDTAIVAFRLVGTQVEPPQIMNFFNTGTFLKRNGLWQVVAWQATRIPAPE
jgi:hypothetical protein